MVNHAIHKHFKLLIKPGAQYNIAICLRCGGYGRAAVTGQMVQHLEKKCTEFKKWEKVRLAQLPKTAQPILSFALAPWIDPDRKRRANKKLALAVFTTHKPFAIFEDDTWTDAFSELGYKPPTRHTLSNKLLDDVYTEVKGKVVEVLEKPQSLQITTDESSNISKQHIINYSVLTGDGQSFFWENVEAPSGTLDAATLADHFITNTKAISNNDLSQVVSVTTNTCSTMQNLWKELEKRETTKHILSVPCDSHGLQLLIKDILESYGVVETWNKCTTIANTLRNSTKQLVYLRDAQDTAYGKHKSLIASVITRWGTQYRLINSVKNNEAALKLLACSTDAEFAGKEYLQDREFWYRLNDLLELLRPIHEWQKASKSNSASVSYVFERWFKIHQHLTAIVAGRNEFAGAMGVFMIHQQGRDFNSRIQRQCKPIHVAAHFLKPENWDAPVLEKNFTEIEDVFERYSITSEKATKCLHQWLDFRGQKGWFAPTSRCWAKSVNPKLFWAYSSIACPELARIAQVLMEIVGDSVPSERAFSAMNLIHSKSRNSLSNNHANKLIFVAMNTRALRNMRHFKISEDELVALENSHFEKLQEFQAGW